MAATTTEAPPVVRAGEGEPDPTLRSGIVGEVIGTFILVFIGCGSVVAATVFNQKGSTIDGSASTYIGGVAPVAVAWLVAVALAIYVGATLSGAHFNPAITIALAATGRHPWRRVPTYLGAQLVGAFLGAASLVLLFGSSMKSYAKTQGISYGAPGSEKVGFMLTTYVPHPQVIGNTQAAYDQVPIWRGFTAEVLCTAILLLVVLALLETRHTNAPAAWFFPLVVGVVVFALILIEAPLTMTSLNPARDLGPRTMLLIMGFGHVAFPGPRHGWSMAVTTLGPIVGALLGAAFFDLVLRRALPYPERESGAVEEPGQLAGGPERA